MLRAQPAQPDLHERAESSSDSRSYLGTPADVKSSCDDTDVDVLLAKVRQFCLDAKKSCSSLPAPENSQCEAGCNELARSCSVLNSGNLHPGALPQVCADVARKVCLIIADATTSTVTSKGRTTRLISGGAEVLAQIAALVAARQKTKEAREKANKNVAGKREERNACGHEVNCDGNLGISRAKMPQYESVGDFASLFRTLYSHLPSAAVEEADMPGRRGNHRTYFPIQDFIGADKLESALARCQASAHGKTSDKAPPMLPPILIEGEESPGEIYVLDGHHRVFAAGLCDIPNFRSVLIRVPGMYSRQAAVKVMDSIHKDKPKTN